MSNNSEIHVGNGGTTFVGIDAVSLFSATALKHGLSMYAKFKMMPNRAWTPTAMLKAATRLTGKKYKRGQHQIAADDVKVWCDAMASALPIVRQEGGAV